MDGIRAVANGQALLAPAVTQRLIETFVQQQPRAAVPPPALQDLTDREQEILRLMARGLSNAEIADELVVSAATVKTHVARVLNKLDLRDRVQERDARFAHERAGGSVGRRAPGTHPGGDALVPVRDGLSGEVPLVVGLVREGRCGGRISGRAVSGRR